jgi:hypothetical protein
MKPESPSSTESHRREKAYENILNPLAQQKLSWDIHPLVERPAALEGKTVYVINQRWGGTRAHEPLLLAVKKWLEDRIPGLNVVYKVKLGSYPVDDPDLWEEVGQKAAAAIIGVPH